MLADILIRFRALLRRQAVESELDEELRFHFDQQVQKLVQSGLPPVEARRRARILIGASDQIKEECRDARGVRLLETTAQDVRYGARMLGKSPGFTTAAVLTLAVGVGANAAIFSVVNGVLLKPLPYPRPEQLVSVELSPLALDPSLRGIAPEDYFVFRDQATTFQDIGIYVETDADRDVNVTSLGEPERVHALNVTRGVLSGLGVTPVLGRLFSARDDSPGAPATAILSYAYWQRRLGGDPYAIGKAIVVDGRPRQIVGVLPQGFRFLDTRDLALLLPLQLDRDKTYLGNFSYFGIARLRPGRTIDEASADVARMLPVVMRTFPAGPSISLDLLEKARLAPSLRPLKQEIVGDVGALLWVLMGGLAVVLLIACANVANLLLVRTQSRRQELALRAALGASRRRIALQLLHESATLGLLGGACGLGLAWAALRVLVRLAPAGLPRVAEIGIDLHVLFFTLALTLLATLVSGLAPILQHAGVRAGDFGGGRTVGQSRHGDHARRVLVGVQVALALVLLTCSGLMIRSFRALTRVDPGFARPAELQTFRLAIPESEVRDDASVPRVEQQILEALARIPGVSSVGFGSAVPLDGNGRLDNVFAEDRAYRHGELPPLRHLVFVSPGYFHTLGIPLVAGRRITWTDTYNEVPVALVSENFAREYWRTPEDAVGKRIRVSSTDEWREIIGVVGDVRDQGMDKPARSDVYWPPLMARFRGRPLRVTRYAAFAVRSQLAGSPSLVDQIRRAVRSVDAALPVAGVRRLSDLYRDSMARTSFTLVMLGLAGVMSLLLGAVGLYGVIADSVSQRTREIGVRMAVGARPGDILRLVLAEAVWVVLVGLGAGLVASLASTRFLSSLLFGVRATDPLTFGGVVILLAVVALLACYLPARRATRIDPSLALRQG